MKGAGLGKRHGAREATGTRRSAPRRVGAAGGRDGARHAIGHATCKQAPALQPAPPPGRRRRWLRALRGCKCAAAPIWPRAPAPPRLPPHSEPHRAAPSSWRVRLAPEGRGQRAGARGGRWAADGSGGRREKTKWGAAVAVVVRKGETGGQRASCAQQICGLRVTREPASWHSTLPGAGARAQRSAVAPAVRRHRRRPQSSRSRRSRAALVS